MNESLDKWIDAFPEKMDLKFKLRPSGLYTVADLYDAFDPNDAAASWKRCYDYAAYTWFFDTITNAPRTLNIGEAIAARLHDAVIEHAISDFVIRGGSGNLHRRISGVSA